MHREVLAWFVILVPVTFYILDGQFSPFLFFLSLLLQDLATKSRYNGGEKAKLSLSEVLALK